MSGLRSGSGPCRMGSAFLRRRSGSVNSPGRRAMPYEPGFLVACTRQAGEPAAGTGGRRAPERTMRSVSDRLNRVDRVKWIHKHLNVNT